MLILQLSPQSHHSWPHKNLLAYLERHCREVRWRSLHLYIVDWIYVTIKALKISISTRHGVAHAFTAITLEAEVNIYSEFKGNQGCVVTPCLKKEKLTF